MGCPVFDGMGIFLYIYTKEKQKKHLTDEVKYGIIID